MALNKMERNDIEPSHGNGKRMAGLIVITAGVLLLLKKTGVMIPNWLFSWQMLLIGIGLYLGFKHQFKNHAWWIVLSIGLVFLIDRFIVGISIHQFFWPVLIIAIGLVMVFGKKGRSWDDSRWQKAQFFDKTSVGINEDYLDSVAIFGSLRKNIISKDFKGGDVVTVFGGAEINLSQAEIKSHVVLDLVNIMGGTKLIVPAHWEIKSEIVAIFGGIEDKRMMQQNIPSGENVLILRGTSLFGGIDIKSY